MATYRNVLTFNVSKPGDHENAGHTARSVIDEHCIVDHFSFRQYGLHDPVTVIIHFTSANEPEAKKIADEAVKAARFGNSIDAVNLITKKGR